MTGSKHRFFSPPQKTIGGQCFKAPKALIVFILTTVGAGGASSWLINLMLTMLFIGLDRADEQDETQEKIIHWVSNGMGFLLFVIAIGFYLEDKFSRYSASNIKQSIHTQIDAIIKLAENYDQHENQQQFITLLGNLKRISKDDRELNISLLLGLDNMTKDLHAANEENPFNFSDYCHSINDFFNEHHYHGLTVGMMEKPQEEKPPLIELK